MYSICLCLAWWMDGQYRRNMKSQNRYVHGSARLAIIIYRQFCVYHEEYYRVVAWQQADNLILALLASPCTRVRRRYGHAVNWFTNFGHERQKTWPDYTPSYVIVRKYQAAYSTKYKARTKVSKGIESGSMGGFEKDCWCGAWRGCKHRL